MKIFLKTLVLSFLSLVSVNGFSGGLTKAEYEERYDLKSNGDDGDSEAVRNCLRNWTKHPFSKNETYRRVKAGVKVFGIGSKGFLDEEKTTWPQLILVSPGVNVLGKATYQLLNPNGWYCIKANVTVLSKSEIEIACNAHITYNGDGAEVLGSSDKNVDGGVVVLGKLVVKKVGCSK